MLAVLQPGFDRVQRHPLLALQFRDAVNGRVIAEGLEVTLQDLWQPRRVQALVHNRSGVFALHAWPGFNGFAPAAPPALVSPAEASRFEALVRDARGRYLPLRISPALPGKGLWSPEGAAASPPDLTLAIPLFSAATRDLPPAMASLRAELRRASQPTQPAPWARLELWLGSTRLAEGQADEAGRALLIFPLPRPREAALGASPAGSPPPFEWTVTLRAWWNPGLAAGTVPNFDDVFSQPEATLLRAPTPALPLPPLPLPPLLLRAGETLMAQQSPESFVYVAD